MEGQYLGPDIYETRYEKAYGGGAGEWPPKSKAPANIEDKQTAKYDYGKIKPSRVPPEIINRIANVREYGEKKYNDPENWRKVEPQRYWDAVLRHALAAWEDWQAIDPESGLLHIAHMACNLAFLFEQINDD